MPRNTCILLGLLCILAAACGGVISADDDSNHPNPTATLGPWDPQDGDENLARGEAFVNEAQIILQEGEAHQHILRLTGALPTPCHQYRVIIPEPDDQDQIHIEVYSLSDPAEICIQVLEPFEANIPFAELPSGEYEVFVNGESIGFITP